MDSNDFLGNTDSVKEVRRVVGAVGLTDIPVLLLGESGVGKDLVARIIHDISPRNCHPFVAVDCPTVPPGLFESELFGHERGAFTGATASGAGRLQMAENGTIFFDEIGDMPAESQVKLLRFLNDTRGTKHEYLHLGGRKKYVVDARIIAATNRELLTLREDLRHRVSVFPLYIPPLRERPSDIPILVRPFLETSGMAISRDALKLLRDHGWPGNVRELHNVIQAACVFARMSERDEIVLEDIHLKAPSSRVEDELSSLDFSMTLAEGWRRTEKFMIERALTVYNWNRTLAAQRLGICNKSIFEKIRKYGIEAPLGARKHF